jgi:hypothetical protein
LEGERVEKEKIKGRKDKENGVIQRNMRRKDKDERRIRPLLNSEMEAINGQTSMEMPPSLSPKLLSFLLN